MVASSCISIFVGELARGLIRVARMTGAECSRVTSVRATLTGAACFKWRAKSPDQVFFDTLRAYDPVPQGGEGGVVFLFLGS